MPRLFCKNHTQRLEGGILALVGKRKARRIANLALDVKAEKVLMFDVRKKSNITDFVIICQGRSQGHVKGIADKVQQSMKEKGMPCSGVEGFNEGSWILMDYEDTLLHIFHPETREYYKLEKLQEDCPMEEISDEE